MTQEELLKDTINHFNSDNRCYGKDGCQYAPTGAHTQGCAIGRFLSTEAQELYDKNRDDHSDISLVAIDEIFRNKELKPLAPEWMQKMDTRFLCAVQGLHDTDGYWNQQGVNENGWDYVDRICSLHNIPRIERV